MWSSRIATSGKIYDFFATRAKLKKKRPDVRLCACFSAGIVHSFARRRASRAEEIGFARGCWRVHFCMCNWSRVCFLGGISMEINKYDTSTCTCTRTVLLSYWNTSMYVFYTSSNVAQYVYVYILYNVHLILVNIIQLHFRNTSRNR